MVLARKVNYPKKSHRKKILLPEHSVELAEFFGILLGDGGISSWQSKITVNAVADLEYVAYVEELCITLFGIRPAIYPRRSASAVDIVLNSVNVVEFLTSQGLHKGNKLSQGLAIPPWILSRPEYRAACIRGLFDTDGCLYIHAHRVAGKEYRNIGACFNSASPQLIGQVASIFEESGIIPHIDRKGRNIFLYSAQAVERYLQVFGTSNNRIKSVYERWRVRIAV